MALNPDFNYIFAKDFGFSSTKSKECLDLFERGCADFTKDPGFVIRGGLVDISKFGENWDFNSDFCLQAEIEMFSLREGNEIFFGLISPSVNVPSALSLFNHSQHLPVDRILSNYYVPRLFFGSRWERNPYLRALNRLRAKDKRLILVGTVTFKRDKSERVGVNGVNGLLTVSAYLPRYDYLAGHLQKYF